MLDLFNTLRGFLKPNTISDKATGIEGQDFVKAGISGHDPFDNNSLRYLKYYQWVCFILFFQAISFYAPRYLWKWLEGNKIKFLVENVKMPILNNECKGQQKDLIVTYFINNIREHDAYALKFFICESLNFINVGAQIFLIHYFLDGEFFTYGINTIKFMMLDPEARFDPMS